MYGCACCVFSVHVCLPVFWFIRAFSSIFKIMHFKRGICTYALVCVPPVCVSVMLVVFPQSPLLCRAASSSILLWQLGGTPSGGPTPHTAQQERVCVIVCMCMGVSMCDSRDYHSAWALTHMHRPNKHKYSHAPLTLTWMECQHPYNANERLFPTIWRWNFTQTHTFNVPVFTHIKTHALCMRAHSSYCTKLAHQSSHSDKPLHFQLNRSITVSRDVDMCFQCVCLCVSVFDGGWSCYSCPPPLRCVQR